MKDEPQHWKTRDRSLLKGFNDSSYRSSRRSSSFCSFVSNCYVFSPRAGGLCLWLILWLVVVKPGGVRACPRLCVCYPTPMTVSCQSQNITIVPAGVPYNSQRVFLQNNRITELRTDSFGFETQVQIPFCLFPALRFFFLSISSCFSCFIFCAGALAVWQQHHLDRGWSLQ